MGYYSCNGCTLNIDIEEYRKQLNNLIINDRLNFLDEQVIECSQALDKLISKCAFCERNLAEISMSVSA